VRDDQGRRQSFVVVIKHYFIDVGTGLGQDGKSLFERMDDLVAYADPSVVMDSLHPDPEAGEALVWLCVNDLSGRLHFASEHVEHRLAVFGSPGHRPDGVERPRQRDATCCGHQSERRFEASNAAESGRDADAATSIATQASKE
jgi:hypothetical protein